MKMPRSQCETGNVQFVQELAEVDGPFEAPININFRDLTKLELPSLVWNRSDACPRKMKITNTGHTVIVSGKWKCERPYLTGGPLSGKYVFSQIHFHWGQTDCKGSEHQICGEEFPLEMHVAHFKTEYMTQECALREKDGMVIVVYLFKLQEEPNHSLKKLINSLPRVKQPSTSYAIDPRPILSLCNPFTDDYFMYWGSVVTSTCAHILLWIICREPFGISKEQVSEFRKIMDSSQQPIFKNSREVQPLHKRNVFHVNASKHLDDPLLPIKNMLGCYCKESKDAFNTSNSCHCQGAFQNQEDVEGNFDECATENQCSDFKGMQTMHSCFANKTFVVQAATMQSLSIILKKPGSNPVKNQCSLDNLKKAKSEIYNQQVKLVSKSCCFFPSLKTEKINSLTQERKVREKSKLFSSMKAFSQIMHSLEALKNHTFKKLKKIESINQEIKEMKPFCQDTEDKRWIRKIEKILTRHKRFTIKSSQGCLSELKKLAKDCNFDKYFETKPLPAGTNGQKMVWLTNSVIATAELPCYDTLTEEEGVPRIENASSKHFDIGKAIKFSSEAQKLIESFFEDIRDSDDLQETVARDPNFKKIKSLCNEEGDSKSISIRNKGYITQKMFNLGKLGDRFFTEITTEDINLKENWEFEVQNKELTTAQDVNETKNILDRCESEKSTEIGEPNTESKSKNEDIIHLHRVNIPILLPKANKDENEAVGTLRQDAPFKDEKNQKLSLKKTSKKTYLKKSVKDNEEKFYNVKDEKLSRTQEVKVDQSNSKRSSSNLSTDSMEIQKMKTEKVQKFRKGFSEQNRRKSSVVFKISSKKLRNKTSCKKFEGTHTQKRNQKNKKQKNLEHKNTRYKSLCSLSLTSKEEANGVLKKSLQERVAKGLVKIEVEKKSDSTEDFELESALLSPEKKKLKSESKKPTALSSKEDTFISLNKNSHLTTTETRTIITDPSTKYRKTQLVKQELFKEEETIQKLLKESSSEERQSFTFEITGNEATKVNKAFANRTYRASSVDSKTSYAETRALKEFEENQCDLRLKNPTLKRGIPKLFEGKYFSRTKCQSLTNVSIKPSVDFTQRLPLESIESRRKTNKNNLVKKLKESNKIIKELPRDVSNETQKNLNEEQKQRKANQTFESQEKCESKSQNKAEHDTEFSTQNFSQVGDEFLSKFQVQDGTWKNMEKRRTGKKFRCLDKTSQQPHEELFEILRLTDSEKSFARNSFKGEADFFGIDSKSFQTSVSCSTLNNNSTIRPHSADALHPLKKTQRRKGKKHPHCRKRTLRQYIRKNYPIFRKPSKPFNFLSLTDEEQLKIISVNVAKYIKQKLMDEKSQPETEKNSPDNFEKELKNLNITEKKSEEAPSQRSPTVNPQKAKKFRIPVLKPMEITKEKEKCTQNMKKSNPIESQIEAAGKKSESASSPRPVNNFIKLNKQMAGTYKRLAPKTPKKMESKEKEKLNLETKATDKISKPKTKVQKKTKEKILVQKPREKPSNKPPTPSSPITQTPSPKKFIRKEKQIKSSATSKKPDSNNRSTNRGPSSPKVEKPNEYAGVKCKPDSEKILSAPANPKETRPKKLLAPTCTVDPNSPAPKITKNINGKNFQHEIIKYDTQKNVEDDSRKEALFKKELEYFITMQMFLNNEIPKDIENPLHYFKSKLLMSDHNVEENQFQNYANDSLQSLDFSNKDVVIVKKKNTDECLSSCSELTEQLPKFSLEKDSADEKNESSPKSEKIVTVKAPKEFCNSTTVNSTPVQEGSEGIPSDSSYDCKISITLNTNLNSKETESKRQGHDTYCLEENCNSQTTTSLEESSSQLTDVKLLSNKRIESEISLEMKQKLLEILEGEIKREIGISCGASSGNSSDGLAFKAGDSEGNLRNQSTESSSDNIEALAQISTTMRQYLTYLREMKRLPDEGKNYEEF